MKRTFPLFLLACSACGSSDDDPGASPSDDAGVQQGDAADAAVDTQPGLDGGSDVSPDAATFDAGVMLAAYLAGRFDSQAQSEADYSYYPINLVMCPISLPDLGDHVLYVEQSVMDPPSAPYRQRLYVVEPLDPPETHAVSRVYELTDPAAAVGLCDGPRSLDLTTADVIERSGCDVEMEWVGDHFEGGTVGTECASSLHGASCATSEVVLTEDQLTSWDRGYDAEGNQVWGATKGPYIFDRKTPLELP